MPETLKESLIFCSRFENGAWVKGRTFEENKEKVLMLEVAIRYKLCFFQHFLTFFSKRTEKWCCATTLNGFKLWNIEDERFQNFQLPNGVRNITKK